MTPQNSWTNLSNFDTTIDARDCCLHLIIILVLLLIIEISGIILTIRRRKMSEWEDCGYNCVASRFEDAPKPDGRERPWTGHIRGQCLRGTGRDATEVRTERRDLRERLSRQTSDRWAEVREPQEVDRTLTCGTRLRLYGKSDARADRENDRNSESDSTHLPEMPDL